MPIFALTKEKIVSNALNLLGSPAITSFASGGEVARAASDAYDYLLPTDIAKNNWRFATKLQQISLLVETPIIDNWLYIYQLPTDYLAFVRTHPLIPYQIFGNKKFYCNQPSDQELILEYRFAPDPEDLPLYFVDYFQYSLATVLALSVAHSIQTSEIMQKRTAIEFQKAIFADSQSNLTRPIRSNPFITCRGASSRDITWGG